MKRILVVEDELAQAEFLKQLLPEQGYKVFHAHSGEEAIRKLKGTAIDLVLLDIGLPGMSGAQVCAEIKKDPDYSKLPIIMLTTQNHASTKVDTLNSGADDYVTKPFHAKELIARIAALFRRLELKEAPNKQLKAGKLSIDLTTHEAYIGKDKLDLRPKEYELLLLFLTRKGRVMNYSFIAESVWGDDRVATREDVRWWVHQLRAKLGKVGDCIETVVNTGYKFVDP